MTATPTSVRDRATAFGPEASLWVVVAIWASSFIAIKDAFSYIDPLPFTLLRFVGINLLAWGTLGVLRLRNPALSLRIDRADLPQFAFASLTGYTIYQMGYVLSLDRTSVFTLALVLSMVPLFTSRA